MLGGGEGSSWQAGARHVGGRNNGSVPEEASIVAVLTIIRTVLGGDAITESTSVRGRQGILKKGQSKQRVDAHQTQTKKKGNQELKENIDPRQLQAIWQGSVNDYTTAPKKVISHQIRTYCRPQQLQQRWYSSL